jgi:hypothetical protein
MFSFSLLVLLTSYVVAAEQIPEGIMQAPWERRQATPTSTINYSTLGYWSAGSDAQGIRCMLSILDLNG